MRRITQVKNNENVLLLEECKDNWSISSNKAKTRYWIRGTAVDRLAAYEDTKLDPEEIEALKSENKGLNAFKEYFMERYANDAIDPSYFEEAIECMEKAEERSKENA